jgi:hypothetical protein
MHLVFQLLQQSLICGFCVHRLVTMGIFFHLELFQLKLHAGHVMVELSLVALLLLDEALSILKLTL